MELGKQRKYCIPIDNEQIDRKNLVGDLAIKLNQLIKVNVNVPSSFVITGRAFDDFIVANDLVDFIVEAISSAKPEAKENTKLAGEIKNIIKAGEIPKLLEKEIKRNYEAISTFGESYVEIDESPLNSDLVSHPDPMDFQNIKGFENLLLKVKEMWSNLFSANSLAYRAKVDYEGNLSQPLVIRKAINSEVSGLSTNFDIGNLSLDRALVIASLGIPTSEDLNPFSKLESVVDRQYADYYQVLKATGKVLNEINNPQKFMLVRAKQKSEVEKSPLTKVKISKTWSERHKLDELQIRKLMNTLSLIETIESGTFLIQWGLESGKIFVIDIRDVSAEEVHEYTKFGWLDGGIKAMGDVAATPLSYEDEQELPALTEPAVSEREEPISKKEFTTKLSALLSEPAAIPGAVNPTVNPDNLVQNDLVDFLKKRKDEFILTPDEREQKSHTVRQMVPEIKTVTEVWWNKLLPASEIKVFLNNIDGFGEFSMLDVADALAVRKDMDMLHNSTSLQKQICDYLAIYLVAVSPKPLFIRIEEDLDLDAQIEVLSQLRNLYGHRNFWVTLPEVSEMDEIVRYKKMLFSGGFRRTNVFKIFQRVSQPLFLANLDTIKEQLLDGILIDLDALYRNTLGLESGSELVKLHKNMELFQEYLLENLTHKAGLKLFTIVKTESQQMLDGLFSSLLEAGVNGMYYNQSDLFDFKQRLSEEENKILTNSLKKIKEKVKRIQGR